MNKSSFRFRCKRTRNEQQFTMFGFQWLKADPLKERQKPIRLSTLFNYRRTFHYVEKGTHEWNQEKFFHLFFLLIMKACFNLFAMLEKAFVGVTYMTIFLVIAFLTLALLESLHSLDCVWRSVSAFKIVISFLSCTLLLLRMEQQKKWNQDEEK